MSFTIEPEDLLLFALTLDDCSKENVLWGELLLKVEDRKGLVLWIETMRDVIDALRNVRQSEREKQTKGKKWKR